MVSELPQGTRGQRQRDQKRRQYLRRGEGEKGEQDTRVREGRLVLIKHLPCVSRRIQACGWPHGRRATIRRGRCRARLGADRWPRGSTRKRAAGSGPGLLSGLPSLDGRKKEGEGEKEEEEAEKEERKKGVVKEKEGDLGTISS